MESESQINILMVDDSPTNLLALEAILQGPERNLVSASSGDDALRYLLDNEVAVILMDVYMPGLDGLETAELIRGRDRSRNIPIIFLTADSTGGRHLSRGYSLGAVDFIVKPVEPDILRSKVNVFVELFKKTREIKRQAQLLQEKNLQLEDANLARLNMLIDLGQKLAGEGDPAFDPEFPQVSERVLNILLTNKRPLRLNESDELLPDPALVSDAVQSFLGAPILSSTKGRGWLYLINKLDADG